MRKVLLGQVGVDSGQLMVSDPCYVKYFEDRDDGPQEFTKGDNGYSYTGACSTTLYEDDQGGELGNGMGVVFSSGFGDGAYDVHAYLDEIDGWGERVVKVEITLIGEEA